MYFKGILIWGVKPQAPPSQKLKLSLLENNQNINQNLNTKDLLFKLCLLTKFGP